MINLYSSCKYRIYKGLYDTIDMQFGGIYRILNTTNNKEYIGSTNNFKRRWDKELRQLRNGYLFNNSKIHPLLRAWKKYGEQAFRFEILEIVNGSDCLLRSIEQLYLDDRKPYKCGYNIRNNVNNLSGWNHTDEAKEKIRITSLGRRHTQEAKDKMSTIQKERLKDPDLRAKLKHNRPVSEKTRKALREWLDNGGRETISARRKASKKPRPEKIAKDRTKEYVIVTPLNTVINIKNLSNFCRDNNLHLGHLTEIAQSKRKTYKGWKCFYKEEYNENK